MKQRYQSLLLILLLSTISIVSFAQDSFFSDIAESKVRASGIRTIVPQKFRMLEANSRQLRNFLWSLPSENNILNRTLTPEIVLPLPNGTTQRFHVWESSIQEPGLEAKFPEIRTFCGQGIDDPYATIRLDYNPYFGFHAQVLTINGTFYIDPYSRGDVNHYMSYFRNEYSREVDFVCLNENNEQLAARPEGILAGPCRGTQLKTYRLAIACTGEYAVAVGGTTAALLHAAIVTSANRVTGVYETELSVRLVLVATNNLIEFLTASTDPFTGNNNAGTLINESQTQINTRIGSANYDIGHTFSTGGGGLASLGVVCNNTRKASGITGSPSPRGDAYDIDFVAHEMGHQFGGSHTFNSSTSSCGGGNRSGTEAYEVGGGTTIMAYAGICGSDDIQPHSDPTFHAISFDEISSYVAAGGAACGVLTSTGNTLPVITSMSNSGVSIPISTPFTLTGIATDADNDPLTYCWEEWDLGASTTWNGGTANTTSPLMKSRLPKTTGSRTFPDYRVIAANYPANPTAAMNGLKGETLPNRVRAMKFRLTVRDNKAGGGGIVSGGSGCQTGFTTPFTINIAGTTPFAVTYPNGGESFVGGSSATATWNVASTNASPFNTTKVKISISTDGGLTFPTVLLDSTDNDGSESVVIPAVVTTTARIKVEAIGNIFFDISNANFRITQATDDFSFNATTPASVTCGIGNSANFTLGTSIIGGFSTTINLSTTGSLPAGTSVTFNPTSLSPGSSTTVTIDNISGLATGTYNITVSGVAGTISHTATLTLNINPGTPPSITLDPSSAQICTGNNTSLTASAPGATSNQWQVSTNGGTTWSNITNGVIYSGATTDTLNIANATIGLNGYQYHMIASTPCGSDTSASATVTVSTTLSIITSPQSVTACEGQPYTFTCSAAGAGLTYQWQVSTDAGNSFTNITGATSSNYTISNVTLSLASNIYNVIINGSCPGGPDTSSNAVLGVTTSTSISNQPSPQTVCAGDNANFNVTVTGSNITYQWAVSTNGSTFTNIPGATLSTLSLSGTTAAQNGYIYHVTAASSCSINPLVSNDVTLTVNQPVIINAQPLQTISCDSNAIISIQAIATGISYQWQVSTNGGANWSNVTNAGVYSGATTQTLAMTGLSTLYNGYLYHCVVSGTCNPSGVTSDSALLSISTTASINTQPKDTTICITGNTTVSFSVTTSGSIASYQWQVSTDGGTTWTDITGATSASYTTGNLVPANNGNLYHVKVIGDCNTVTSTSALLTATAGVSITTQPIGNLRICIGQSATDTVIATNAVSYQWEISTDGGTTWTNIPGAITATYTVNNADISQNNDRIRVIVTGTSACGSLTSSTTRIRISGYPTVGYTATPAEAVCPGTEITLRGTGTQNYIWDNGVTNNTPFIPLTSGTYTVIGSNFTGCKDTATVNITVFPTPTVTLTVSPGSTVQPGGIATITATSNPAGSSYEWYHNGTVIAGATSNTLSVLYFTPADLGNYYAIATDINTCVGTSNDVTLLPGTTTLITPNPTNIGYFEIHLPITGFINPTRIVSMYDGKGALVYQNSVATVGSNPIKVETSKFSKGVYMIDVTDVNGKRIVTAKVIISAN